MMTMKTPAPTEYLVLVDDRPLADILKYAAAHATLRAPAETHDTIEMAASTAAPRATVPASPKGKRAGAYSVVAAKDGTDGGAS